MHLKGVTVRQRRMENGVEEGEMVDRTYLSPSGQCLYKNRLRKLKLVIRFIIQVLL